MTKEETRDIRIRAARAMGWTEVNEGGGVLAVSGTFFASRKTQRVYLYDRMWTPDSNLSQSLELARKVADKATPGTGPTIRLDNHESGRWVARIYRTHWSECFAETPALALTLAALQAAEVEPMRTDWFKVAEGVVSVTLAALAIAFMFLAVTRDEDSRRQIYQSINEVGR